MDGTLLHKHPRLPIYVRQFGEGAREAGEDRGISVIIDNFRASNTILALLDARAIITPVETIEEALSYTGYIKIGEKDGKKHELFEFDNSPYIISMNKEYFTKKQVVLRTTNGTRGIINAKESDQILIGSFRNLDVIVDYCQPLIQAEIPVSFVAMGSKLISRIEDYYCAQMMFFKITENLISTPDEQQLVDSMSNPWNIDWLTNIKKVRPFTDAKKMDRTYAVQLNKTSMVPSYNKEEKIIELIN